MASASTSKTNVEFAEPILSEFSDYVAKYEQVEKIGKGTYSEVYKVKCINTSTLVALKKVEVNEHLDFPNTALREIQILQHLKHENVINLIEVFRKTESTDGLFSFYLILDLCQRNLREIINNMNVELTFPDIKSLMHQLIKGLNYIHKSNVLHRDLKPANILLTQTGSLKIADFGLSRIHKESNDGEPNQYTNRVVSLWYRPPEILLGGTDYGPEVDVWSAGCIIAEMFTRAPIMRGDTNKRQLSLITELCGSITKDVWPNVNKLKKFSKMGLIKNQERILFEKLLPDVSNLFALDLIDRMLILDPAKRINSETLLGDMFFEFEPHPSDLTDLMSRI